MLVACVSLATLTLLGNLQQTSATHVPVTVATTAIETTVKNVVSDVLCARSVCLFGKGPALFSSLTLPQFVNIVLPIWLLNCRSFLCFRMLLYVCGLGSIVSR